MPRESAASLSVLRVQSLARIEPPFGLTDAEVALFLAVVNSKPAEWFGPDSAPLLVEYVRAQSMCDLLDDQIKAHIRAGESKEVREAMKLRDMESRRLVSFATKMRLSQQSRIQPDKAGTGHRDSTQGTKLWQRQPRSED